MTYTDDNSFTMGCTLCYAYVAANPSLRSRPFVECTNVNSNTCVKRMTQIRGTYPPNAMDFSILLILSHYWVFLKAPNWQAHKVRVAH